jgi:hypothetical protein
VLPDDAGAGLRDDTLDLGHAVQGLRGLVHVAERRATSNPASTSADERAAGIEVNVCELPGHHHRHPGRPPRHQQPPTDHQ